MAALMDGDVEIRRIAARGLSELGPDAREAVPAVIKALRDRDDQVRSGAAATLGNGGRLSIELPALTEALKDPAPAVQLSAVRAVARLGPAAKSLVPALLARIDTTTNDLIARRHPNQTLDLFILKEATEAIGAIGPDAKDAIPSLIESIGPGDSDYFFARPAIRALGEIGPAAKRAIPKINEVLEREYPPISRRK